MEPSWSHAMLLHSDDGPLRLLLGADGALTLEHHCTTTIRALPIVGTVDHWQPITVTPAVHCPDCGLHGHIIAGQWIGV